MYKPVLNICHADKTENNGNCKPYCYVFNMLSISDTSALVLKLLAERCITQIVMQAELWEAGLYLDSIEMKQEWENQLFNGLWVISEYIIWICPLARKYFLSR